MYQESCNQNIICADLSMRRPGFALLFFDAKAKTITVVRKSNVDNKFTKKTHGEMLGEIAKEFRSYISSCPTYVLVREKGFFKHPTETQVLCKVIGVTDLYAWALGKMEFDEIAPQSVKKTVAGNAKASKEDVADAQKKYVGEQDYACDDESDAVAVGIAWLIQHGYIEEMHPV